MQRALTQLLLGKKARRELLAFLDSQLPRLGAPPARSADARAVAVATAKSCSRWTPPATRPMTRRFPRV